MPTFAEKFCEMHHLQPEQFELAVLKVALHRRAQLLRLLLGLNRDYFEADLDFIRGVGRIRSLRQFDLEAQDFAHHAANRWFMRRHLRLRVSSRRLKSLVYTTLGPAGSVLDDRTVMPWRGS